MSIHAHLARFVVVVGCYAVFLAGCGKKADEQATAKSGQVVARVAEQTITTQELDHELRLANIPPDKQKDPAVIKPLLSQLVTRKYLLNQALNLKLDREPGVLLELLRAREQVLENAYLMRVATSKAPSQADVESFVVNNPSKFAARKALSVDQIVFTMGPKAQALVEASRDSKALDEIAERLTSNGVPFNRSQTVLSSGDLPNEFNSAIAAKRPDDIFFIRSGQNGLYFKVLGEELRSLTGEAAANVARQIMRADAIKAEAGLAAYSASLEAKYEGDYAKIMRNESTAK